MGVGNDHEHHTAASASSFAAIRELIFAVAGISKTEEKEELVKSRLAARLRELKIAGYEEYLDRIRATASSCRTWWTC
jgi:chemotaxis methyl-accepting protein methylase